jgi:hypothetical protein
VEREAQYESCSFERHRRKGRKKGEQNSSKKHRIWPWKRLELEWEITKHPIKESWE